MSRFLKVLLLAVLVLGLAGGALSFTSSFGQAQLRTVKVVLQWRPNVEFSGLWWGIHGFTDENGQHISFADRGLQIDWTPWSQGVDPNLLVSSGEYDFGINDGAAVIISVAQGMPIKAIAISFGTSPFCFTTLRSSGITTVKDFKGKRVGYQSHELYVLEAMLAYNGMSLDDVKAIPVGFDPTPLITGDVDAWLSYIGNEPITLRLEGYQVNEIWASENGYRVYGGAIFTNTRLIEDDPQLVTDFLDVFLAGWRYAVQHPLETTEMVLQNYFHPELTVGSAEYQKLFEHQRREMLIYSSQAIYHRGLDLIGDMYPEDWQEAIDILYNFHQIDEKPDVNAVFTRDFLEEVLPKWPREGG